MFSLPSRDISGFRLDGEATCLPGRNVKVCPPRDPAAGRRSDEARSSMGVVQAFDSSHTSDSQ